jgi:hypothetical protein
VNASTFAQNHAFAAGAMANELLLAATAADDSDEVLRLIKEDGADPNVQ